MNRSQFATDGYCLLDPIDSDAQLQALRDELRRVLARRREVMASKGMTQGTEGTGHHLLECGSPFVDWLGRFVESPGFGTLRDALGGPAILNSFGAVDNRKGSQQYVGAVHRDVRTFMRERRLMVQVLLPLDDFTPASGATWLLAGSHLSADKPTDSEFSSRAVQVTARAGHPIFFDSRVWHAAGINRTDDPRRALTLTFTPSSMKPQFDYCRYLGYDYVEALPDVLKQALGYFSRVPASLDEWYRPPEQRFYRRDQD